MLRRQLGVFALGLSVYPKMASLQMRTSTRVVGAGPVWLGFGLNGSANQDRFSLTRDYVKKIKMQGELSNVSSFDWYRDSLNNIVKNGQTVNLQFKKSIEIGQDLLAGFAHDYETIVACRLEKNGRNANQILVFMSGVGLLLAYENSSGWRIASSYPFMMRYEFLENDLSNHREKAIGHWEEVYRNYGRAYVSFLNQNSKKDNQYSANYFARLVKSEIHKDALSKLKAVNIEKFFNHELVGFTTSSAICENLNIPLLPYRENDALAKRYSVRFTDDLRVQDGVEIPDADLRFEIIIRDIDKELIPNMQKGITTIRRTLIVNFKIFAVDGSNSAVQILQTIAYADPDEDKVPFNSKEEDVPDRDIVFYDRLLTRTLNFLFKGIKYNSADLLAKANVKHEKISDAIPKILELCSKTR